MRGARILVAGVGLAVVAAGISDAVLGNTRAAAFAKESKALDARWRTIVAEGVPSTQVQPLRRQLATSQFSSAAWWAPVWWTQTGKPVIDDLSERTDALWRSDMSAARAVARRVVASWQQLQAQLGPYLPAAAVAAASTWSAQIDRAITPNQLDGFVSSWPSVVASARTTALRAKLDAEVAQLGGVDGILSQAQAAEQTAQRINLDDEGIGPLAATLRTQVAAEQDASATLSQLVAALAAFHQLLALNDNVAGTLRPIELSVDQAEAEGTPDGQAFLAQYRTLDAGLTAARESSQLSQLAQQLAALQANVNAELTNDKCGHAVPSGKVITVNLTLQEAVFYQDGCEVQATPVTTGRALLRTPTGTFHVFFKQSPFQFISPWPVTSPFYYFPSWVSWVMEFDGGGYFLHDAPWEPSWQYGPGSEDSSGASHGCIHIPTPVMQWAYSWTPYGTPVLITY